MTLSESLGAIRRTPTAGLVLAAGAVYVAAVAASIQFARHLWLPDLVSFFRPHLFVAGVLLAAVVAASRARGSLALASAVVAMALLPLALAPRAAEGGAGAPLRVMTANLLYDNTRTAVLMGHIERQRPDILVTQETSPLWQDALTGAAGLVHESSRDLAARDDIKLMSRHPILSETVIAGGPRFAGLERHPVRFEIALPAGRLVVYAVHPASPRSLWRWHQRNAYLELLTQAVRSEPPDVPVIVAGDWNVPTWSPFFRDVLDRAGLASTEAGWWPAPTRFSPRFGAIVALGMPIDHVAVSHRIGLAGLSVGPIFGSNHLPVTADLTIR